MEAITVAGLMVVAVGGYYTLKDTLKDMGIQLSNPQRILKCCSLKLIFITPQTKIKKVAGMHI